MAVISALNLNLKITDGTFRNFDTGQMLNSISSMTQAFEADLLIADATVDRPVSLQGIAFAQQIFFFSDQEVSIKLVPQGGTLLGTVGMTLMASVPSVIAVKNIIQIYVSNATGQQARVIIFGAGV